MKWLKRIALGVVAFVLLLWTAVWLMSPTITRMLVGDLLENEHIQLDQSSTVRLNLFRSRLTVNDLVWQRDDQRSFALDALELRYSLFRLVLKEAHIASVTLRGLELQARVRDGELHIAGFDLHDRPPAEEPEPMPEEQSASSRFALKVAVPELIFEDMRFYVTHEDQAHLLHVQRLDVARTLYENEVLDSRIQLEAELNGAPIAFDAEVAYEGQVATMDGRVSVARFDPEHYQYLLPESIEQLSALIGVETEFKLRIEGEHVHLDVASLDVETERLRYADAEYLAALRASTLSLSDVVLSLPEEGGPDLRARFRYQQEDTTLDLVEDQGRLMQLAGLEIREGEMAMVGEDLTLAVEAMTLRGLTASDAAEEAVPPLLTMADFSVEDIAMAGTHLSVGDVAIGRIEVEALMSEAGELKTLVLPGAEEEAEQDESEPTPEATEEGDTELATEDAPAEGEAFTFEIGRIAFAAPATIRFRDEGLSPVFSKQIHIEVLELMPVDNRQPSNETQFRLTLKDDDYLSHEMEGRVQPFSDKMNLSLDAKTRELALNELSPYISDALGFEVKAGQLDNDFTAKIVDDELDGQAKVLLRGANFTSGGPEEGEDLDVIGQTAIPLNVALNMLKDGDGNIKLKIPIDGNVNDPNFGVQYIVGLVVQKAVMSQAKNYLINTFVPYGQVLSVAMSAGSYALKVRFEPLIYAPTQVEPGPEQMAFIDQFVVLMQDKKDLQIQLCPIATPADLNLPVGSTLSSEQRQQLEALADSRADLFKRHVMEKGIESARLLICGAEVKTGESAKPSLKLSV